ncbi:MAG: LysR substrate-binding domain-containing protein [Corynebacterium sp.]|nr:LysR substrate-binding domain-containing protein [Corynebacterium sp.]
MSNKDYKPTLAQLRTFVTIADNRHFGTAANKLGISQPSLSQALVSLESGLGVQLIERSTRRVIVTAAGLELLPYARAVLDAAELFIAQAQGTGGHLTGPLTIGIIPTVAPFILPELLRVVGEEMSDLEPRIVEDQTSRLIEKLREGRLDVAMIAIPSDGGALTEIPLYTERFVLAVPENHPLAGRKDLHLDALADQDMLLLDEGHCLRDQVMSICHAPELDDAPVHVSTTRAASLATVIQCVSAGMGITLLPQSAIPVEGKRPGVALAEFADDVRAERTIGLAYRTSSNRRNTFNAFAAGVVEAVDALDLGIATIRR